MQGISIKAEPTLYSWTLISWYLEFTIDMSKWVKFEVPSTFFYVYNLNSLFWILKSSHHLLIQLRSSLTVTVWYINQSLDWQDLQIKICLKIPKKDAWNNSFQCCNFVDDWRAEQDHKNFSEWHHRLHLCFNSIGRRGVNAVVLAYIRP